MTPKPLQIFIGENAKTWDKVDAVRAQAMEKKGATPEEIWTETGTFRGPEGKWRQEISDQPSKLTLGQHEPDVYGAIEKKTFEGALEHPELQRAYPELNDISFQHWPKEEFEGAWYKPEANEIVLGQKAMNPELGVALHELQHAIQTKEGFARGGNINEFATGPMFDKTARDLTADLSQVVTGGVSAQPLEVLQGLKYTDPKDLEPIIKKYGFNNIDEVKSFIYDENERRTPFGQYQRLAGEAEARATQERLNMTDAERRAKFPYQSYDVPINELIVRKYQDGN
jgi:hypothetical protein